MPLPLDEILAQRRSDSTVGERMVLALEEIAAHLKALAGSKALSGSGQIPTGDRMDDAAVCAPLASWENEGGKIGSSSSVDDGIVRLRHDIFVVGPYRYTSIADARAQLRRSATASRR